MVRQGAFIILGFGLAACTQGVDDPANFTAGNSQGMSAGSSTSASTTGSSEPDTATGVAEGSASATTGGEGADSTTASTIGPADTGDPPAGNCGNGIIDAGEQCDGADLQGFDCTSLGLDSGTLACDAQMCTFDTSMCMSTGGTSG